MDQEQARPYGVPSGSSRLGERLHHWLAYRLLPFLMTMKAPLASLLAASALWGVAPAMALPPLDDFEIELRGEA